MHPYIMLQFTTALYTITIKRVLSLWFFFYYDHLLLWLLQKQRKIRIMAKGTCLG